MALNPFYSYYGKIAITLCILQKEKSSKLREELDPSDYSQDWYKLLFNRMIASFKKPDDFIHFKENKISFVTFNYDRSFDHFLYESFLHTFWENREEFVLSLNKNTFHEYIPFPLIHVYGQVDKLAWHGGRKYKSDFDFGTILKLSEGIRVIGERADPLKKEVINLISESKRIFFLGLSYAIDNLEAVGLPGNVIEKCQIFGTAKKMTLNEIERVKSHFSENFLNRGISIMIPRIEDKTSYELLKEYL